MPPVQTLEEPVKAKDGELCNILLDALINIGSGHPAVVQAAEGMPVLFVIDFVFRRWVINFNCEVGIYRQSNKERIEQHTAFSHTSSFAIEPVSRSAAVELVHLIAQGEQDAAGA